MYVVREKRCSLPIIAILVDLHEPWGRELGPSRAFNFDVTFDFDHILETSNAVVQRPSRGSVALVAEHSSLAYCATASSPPSRHLAPLMILAMLPQSFSDVGAVLQST